LGSAWRGGYATGWRIAALLLLTLLVAIRPALLVGALFLATVAGATSSAAAAAGFGLLAALAVPRIVALDSAPSGMPAILTLRSKADLPFSRALTVETSRYSIQPWARFPHDAVAQWPQSALDRHYV